MSSRSHTVYSVYFDAVHFSRVHLLCGLLIQTGWCRPNSCDAVLSVMGSDELPHFYECLQFVKNLKTHLSLESTDDRKDDTYALKMCTNLENALCLIGKTLAVMMLRNRAGFSS